MFVSILTTLAIVYLCVGALLYFKQKNLLYYPTAEEKGHGLNEIFYEVQGAVVKVLVLNEGKDDAILYFGGNGEAVELNGPEFSELFAGHTVYFMHYRGYGGSSGNPHEAALYQDALIVFDDIRDDHATISVMGRSLGSGVATLVASKRDIHKLVLITPFDSIKNVAQKRFPVYPITVLLKEHYDSLSRIDLINAETLVLIAEHDEVIPVSHSHNLVKKFPREQVTVEIIDNTRHNTISMNPHYSKALRMFLNAGRELEALQ